MKVTIDIDEKDFINALLEDNPLAEWNRDETIAVLNAIRSSVESISDEDKESLCKVMSEFYVSPYNEWTPDMLKIENIGLL